MSAERDEILSSPARLTGVPWRMHLLIGFFGLTTVGMIAYGFHKGQKMAGTHPPLVDAAMVRRSAVNVLSNACQTMAVTEGGADARLTIETATEGGRMLIRVRDTGCGIEKEVMGRIFEPLYTTKGFGVGLWDFPWSISLWGSLEAEFPALASRGRVPRPPCGCPCRQGRNRNMATGRVLIVDDDRDFAEGLADMMR